MPALPPKGCGCGFLATLHLSQNYQGSPWQQVSPLPFPEIRLGLGWNHHNTGKGQGGNHRPAGPGRRELLRALRAAFAPGPSLRHPETFAHHRQVRWRHSAGARASALRLEIAGAVSQTSPQDGAETGFRAGTVSWQPLQSLANKQIFFLTRKLQTKEETKLPAVCRLSPSPSRRSLHAPVNIERRQKPGGICISHLPANEQQEDHTETPARCYYQYVH